MGIRHYSQNWDGFVYGRSFRFCNGNKRLCLRSLEIFRNWKLFESPKSRRSLPSLFFPPQKTLPTDAHLSREAILCSKNTTLYWRLWIYLIFSVSCTFLWILNDSLNFAYFSESCIFFWILQISHNFEHFSEFCIFLLILHISHNFEHFSEFCTFLRHLLSTIKTAPIFKYCTSISKRCIFFYVCTN